MNSSLPPGELVADGPEIGSRAFLQSVLDASDDCIKVLDLDGRLQFMSTGGQEVMEIDDFGAFRGCYWPDFWKGAGNKVARAALAAAQEGRTGRFTGRTPTAKGRMRWWDVVVTAILGEDGSPRYLLSISRDVTERKEAEEQRIFLASELQHRIKNLLSVVSAIAGQTFAGLSPEALASFSARLSALAKSQDVLTSPQDAVVVINDVVTAALAAHRPGSGRFRITGPRLVLSARRVVALSLALHELATNASKYGALSGASGTVDIDWTTAEGTLRFTWAETGGPPVFAPEATGFGTKVIRQNLAGEFDGTVEIDYRTDGLVCVLEAPAALPG